MLKEFKLSPIWLHIIIGLLCLIGYKYGGSAFEIIIIPYVVWMVFKKSSIYLPALSIHLITGNSVMYVIYAAITTVTVLNYKGLSKYRLTWLMNLLLLITPVMLVFLASLIINYKTDFKAYVRLGPFFTLFSFFYGMLLSYDMNKKVIRALLWLMLIYFFIHLSEWLQIRLIFFAIPLWCSLFLIFLYSQKENKLFAIISLGVLAFYLVTFNKSTLTIFLSIVISSVFSVMYFRDSKILTTRFFRIIPFALIAFIMLWGVSRFYDYKPTSISSEDEMVIFEPGKLVDRFEFKLMADRAPFWAAGIKQIIDDANLLPPIILNDIKGEFGNKREFEITFGSHNLYIEVLRYFGLIPGAFVILVFISIVIKTMQIYSFTNLSPLLVVLVSTALAANIVGSITGLYPIQPEFALFSLAFTGVIYALVNSPELLESMSV